MVDIKAKALEYMAILDQYTNQITSRDVTTKAQIHLLLAKMARDVVHWTNNYSGQVRQQVDKLMDERKDYKMREVTLKRVPEGYGGMDGVHVYLPDGRVIVVYNNGEIECYVSESDETPTVAFSFNAQA